MYLSHMEQIKKKAEKETQVTFIPGNKNFMLAAIICCMTIGMLLGAMLAQRRNTIKVYEKKLEKSISALAERNAKEIGDGFDFESGAGNETF